MPRALLNKIALHVFKYQPAEFKLGYLAVSSAYRARFIFLCPIGHGFRKKLSELTKSSLNTHDKDYIHGVQRVYPGS
jgi:hypothetical protein